MNPTDHLKTAMCLYPNAPLRVDELRLERGKSLPKWPAWCFLPMAGWFAIVAESTGGQSPIQVAPDISRLAAIGTWRYTQGVYRFDPDLLAALAESPVSGEIPTEVLYRLPEWCVYVETPDKTWLGMTLYGFWAHLEWDTKTERTELRFLLNTEEMLLPLVLHVGDWTVTEALNRVVLESASRAAAAGINFPNHPGAIEKLSAEINPLVSAVLYICSDEPEIENERDPGTAPSRPKPTKTKHGWRLFPPHGPKIWTVGATIGKQLRETSESEAAKRGVKTHVRRGHWHGYWIGPRDGERRFTYRWLHPVVVSGGENEN